MGTKYEKKIIFFPKNSEKKSGKSEKNLKNLRIVQKHQKHEKLFFRKKIKKCFFQDFSIFSCPSAQTDAFLTEIKSFGI